MPSTRKPTVDDIFAGLGRGQTFNTEHIWVKKMEGLLSDLAEDGGAITKIMGTSAGPIQLRAFVITSAATLDGHATANWKFEICDAGTDGTGTTALTGFSFITDTPTTDKLTAYVAKRITPTAPVSVGSGTVLKLICTPAGSVAHFNGKVELEYVAEV